MRRLASLLAAACILSFAAQAAAQKVATQPSEKPGAILGSLAFQMGVTNNFEDKDAPDGVDGEIDGETTFMITPSIEKMLGSSVAVGFEYMFIWATPDGADESQLMMSPHLRARMAFPVADRITVGAMLGVGGSIWTAGDNPGGDQNPLNSTRFGYSVRFAFGGAFSLNDKVSAFADVGYYTSTTFGDDKEFNFNTIPITVGLRSNF